MVLRIRTNLYSSDKCYKDVANALKDPTSFTVSGTKKRKNLKSDQTQPKKKVKNGTAENQIKMVVDDRQGERSMDSPAQQKKDGICKRFSNDISEAVQTTCAICQTAISLTDMQIHTRKSHNMSMTEYTGEYGQMEIVDLVYHKCGLCSFVMIMDRKTIMNHVRKHGFTFSNYGIAFITKPTTVSPKKESMQTERNKKEDREVPIYTKKEIWDMSSDELLQAMDKVLEVYE